MHGYHRVIKGITEIQKVEDEPSCYGHQVGYGVLGNRVFVAGNASRGCEFCYAPTGTQQTPRAVSQPVETEKNGLVVGFSGKKTTAG